MCREPVGEGAKRVTTEGLGSDGEAMAGVIAPTPAKPSLGERARLFLMDQVAAQTLRWRMWSPVAFGGGCAGYFALKSEPSLWPLGSGRWWRGFCGSVPDGWRSGGYGRCRC